MRFGALSMLTISAILSERFQPLSSCHLVRVFKFLEHLLD